MKTSFDPIEHRDLAAVTGGADDELQPTASGIIRSHKGSDGNVEIDWRQGLNPMRLGPGGTWFNRRPTDGVFENGGSGTPKPINGRGPKQRGWAIG